MNLLQRIVRGDEYRISRLHDQKGNRVDLGGLVYAPHSLLTTFLRLAFDYRPIVPWMPYRAAKSIDTIITRDSKILEFGSGMSTVWLARRSAFVHSIESDDRWYRKTDALLRKHHLTNVTYQLRDQEQYSDLSAYPDETFDLIIVDGILRTQCIEQAARTVKKGGWMYLDNADAEMTLPESDSRKAEQALLALIAERHGTRRYFVDFLPFYFSVSQGLLAHL